MKHTSSPARRLLRAALLPALFLAVLPASARAASVTVDCTAVAPPPGVFTSINAALLMLTNTGPNTITVTGPCTESVNIIMIDRLTIQAPVGQTATINAGPFGNTFNIGGSHNILLSRLVIRGSTSNGVSITRGSSVQLTGVHIKENAANGLRADTGSVVNLGGNLPTMFVTISDNGGAGISADASVLSVGGSTTLENNEGFGLNVIGGRVIFNGTQSENFIRNNGSGANLNETAADFTGQNTISDNGPTGVQVGGGRASFGTSVVGGVPRVNTIEGHTLGINVAAAGSVSFTGPNRIRGNGVGDDPDAQFHGGVRIGTVSRAQFDNGTEITDNTGYGVFLDFNGALAMNGAVVTNNTEGGVRVARSSVGNFGLGSTFSGNGGAQISCDDTSLISGPGLAGLSNKAIACKNIEHEQGPPRPSVPKEQDE